MVIIDLTHGPGCVFDLGGCLNGFRDFAADLTSEGIGDLQFLVVSAGVQGSHNREQSFTGIEGHFGTALSQTRLRHQPEQGRIERASKPTIQGGLQQAGRDAAYFASLRASPQGVKRKNQQAAVSN